MNESKKFEEQIRNADKIITELISNREIRTSIDETDKRNLINFYRKQAKLSLTAAEILLNISAKNELKNLHSVKEDYECFLWVINTAYYSMFYTVHMILAHKSIKIKSVIGIHKITAQAFLYFCIKNNFIAEELYKQFVEIQKEASELLNIDDFKEKAKHLSNDYLYEYDKRSRFTYETTEEIKHRYAITSLARAKEFFNKLRQVIEK